MDETVKLILAVYGGIGTLLLGLIVKGITNISSGQAVLTTTVEVMKTEQANIKEKVDSLHQFRNELTKKQADDIIEENKQLRKELEGKSHV